jgi:hypothetical protein
LLLGPGQKLDGTDVFPDFKLYILARPRARQAGRHHHIPREHGEIRGVHPLEHLLLTEVGEVLEQRE